MEEQTTGGVCVSCGTDVPALTEGKCESCAGGGNPAPAEAAPEAAPAEAAPAAPAEEAPAEAPAEDTPAE